MKTVVVVAHPRISESRLHRAWANALEGTSRAEVRRLYHIYPYWKIDATAEQKLLVENDRIVLQFPFYLYGCPPLMKKWLDDVLTFRWAYGPGGEALVGKQFLIAITTGGPADSYVRGGYHNYSIDELLVPFRQIANLVGASWLRPYVFHRARTVTDDEITEAAAAYVRAVLDPAAEIMPSPRGSR